MAGPDKRKNLRLALILAAVALFFFLSIFVQRLWLT